MKTRNRIISTAALLAACVAGRQSRATPINYQYVTDQPTYTGAAGSTATVDVYLQETLNGNSSFITSENGLYGAAFEVLSSSRPASPSIFTAIAYDAADFTGANDTTHIDNSAVSNPVEADLSEQTAQGASAGVRLGNSGAPSNKVYLGQLTIQFGSTPGTTTFSLGEYSVGGNTDGNTLSFTNNYDLDDYNSPYNPGTPSEQYTGAGSDPYTFSVVSTATPEPASLGFAALGAAGLLLRRRKRGSASAIQE